jgi:UDP-glucose 4-epimerase
VGVTRSGDHDGNRVVVTGGAGFIGHHLVAALASRGADVLVIDDLSSGRPDRLAPSVELARLDIAVDDLAPTIKRWRASTVFHLAAQVSVPAAEAAPEYDLRVNGVGTLRLVAAAKAAGVRRLVFTSSGGAVYGERTTPATERSPTRPMSTYGIHKLLAERYVMTSGIPHAVARPSNVYGPGQDVTGEAAVIAAFVAACREGRSLTIHGDGMQRRDFLHVSDLVAGLLVLGTETTSGIWNVSAGASTSIRKLASIFERIVGYPLELNRQPRRRADVRASRIASGRLKELNWSPREPLDVGLRSLLEGG